MYKNIFEEKRRSMLSSSRDTKKKFELSRRKYRNYLTMLKIAPSKSAEGLLDRILIQNGCWLAEWRCSRMNLVSININKSIVDPHVYYTHTCT